MRSRKFKNNVPELSVLNVELTQGLIKGRCLVDLILLDRIKIEKVTGIGDMIRD